MNWNSSGDLQVSIDDKGWLIYSISVDMFKEICYNLGEKNTNESWDSETAQLYEPWNIGFLLRKERKKESKASTFQDVIW